MADSPRDPPIASVHVPEGEWVEIERVVLRAPARARNVPPDTALTDFVARVRGFLVAGADLGSNATVRTLLDRELGLLWGLTRRSRSKDPRKPRCSD